MKQTSLVSLIVVLVGLAFAAGRCSSTKSSCHEFHEKTGEKKADKAPKTPVFPSVRCLPNCTDPGMVTDSDVGFYRSNFVVDIPRNHKLRVVRRVYVHGKFDKNHSYGWYSKNRQPGGIERSFLTLGVYDPDVLSREDSEWMMIDTQRENRWIKVSDKKSKSGMVFVSEQKLKIGKDVTLGEIFIGRDYSAPEKPVPLKITLEIRLEAITKADSDDSIEFFNVTDEQGN